MSDPFNLARFLTAQDPVLGQVRAELQAGRKQSHWMWFVFPQLAGLGHSAIARHYGISGLEEARAYLAHPLLGPRLLELTALVNNLGNRTAHQIFGSPDDQKFHSSVTLFHLAAPEQPGFAEALQKYFAGAADRATVERI